MREESTQSHLIGHNLHSNKTHTGLKIFRNERVLSDVELKMDRRRTSPFRSSINMSVTSAIGEHTALLLHSGCVWCAMSRPRPPCLVTQTVQKYSRNQNWHR